MPVPVNFEERAFQLISGHRVLDLLATLRDRHGGGLECLREPADLDRWLTVAGLHSDTAATRAQLNRARQLREAVDRVVRAAMRDAAPRAADVRELNEWARRPMLAPQLGRGLELRWSGSIEGALAVLAREAVELVAGPDRALIRECAAAPACSRLYLDRSRSRGRRWCSMNACGSSAKMKSYRRRQKTNSSTPPVTLISAPVM